MNTIFLNVILEMDDEVTYEEEIDFGAVNLACEGREYAVDVCQSYRTTEDGETTFELDLMEDREVLDDCNYLLTDADFHNPKLVADIYIGGDFSANIKSATLFVRQGTMTKAIDLAMA